MSPRRFNPDIVRAALRAAAVRLAETLKDLEENDMDDQSMAGRIQELEKTFRRFAKAA
ncbi:MAG: hypothetical protein IPP35_06545 [Elusimicrobia bacterium]|nr:hypothetical protein [Elusimicrobiota bacterium]